MASVIKLSDPRYELDLLDGVNYNVMEEGIRVGDVERDEETGVPVNRTITILVTVKGADQDTLAQNVQNLVSIVEEARTYTVWEWGRFVTLTIQLDGATNPTVFDVLQGTVRLPDNWLRRAILDQKWIVGVEVELLCRPYSRSSEAEVLALTTLYNHKDDTHTNMVEITQNSVDGNEVAPARIWLKNTSGQQVKDIILGLFIDQRLSGATPEPVIEATDESAYVNASEQGDITASWGKYVRMESPSATGYSIKLNGETAYGVVPAGGALGSQINTFTVEAMINLTALDEYPRVIAARWDPANAATGGDQWVFFIDNKRLRFIAVLANGQTIDILGSTELSTGQWYHVVAQTYTDAGARYADIFLDGILEGSTSASYPGSQKNLKATNSALTIGTALSWIASTTSGSNLALKMFAGRIDEFRLSSTQRYGSTATIPVTEYTPDSDTVLLYHFNDGSGSTATDSSGNGKDMTLRGVTWADGYFYGPDALHTRAKWIIPRVIADHFAGEYKVFGRFRTTGGHSFKARAVWTLDNQTWQDAITVSTGGNWKLYDLGTIQVPRMPVPDDYRTLGTFSETDTLEFGLQVAYSGSDPPANVLQNFHVDFFLLLPLNFFYVYARDLSIDDGDGFVASSIDARAIFLPTSTAYYLVKPGPSTMKIESHSPALAPQLRQWLVGLTTRSDGTHNINDTFQLMVRYIPHWSILR